MNVPAPLLNGFTGAAVQVPGVPGTAGGLDPPDGVGVGVGVGEAVAVGVGDAVRVGVGVGAPVVCIGGGGLLVGPVVRWHAPPWRGKRAGAGFTEPFQLALNPNVVLALVPRV